jgi:hypothetical protein
MLLKLLLRKCTPSGTLNKVVLWRSAIARKEVVLYHTMEPGRLCPYFLGKQRRKKVRLRSRTRDFCLGTDQT